MSRRAEVAALVLLAGALFAVGLAVSGMTEPAKVIGFLDVTGNWDPSLAFVMVGALGVYAAAYHGWAVKMARPFLAPRFSLPRLTAIDAPLIAGAAIFGIGWGLAGFCPGPALVAFGAGTNAALWFVPAMIAGMLIHQMIRPRFDP